MTWREIRREKLTRRRAETAKWKATYKPPKTRAERICFWTPPFGHEWNSGGDWGDTCKICGKVSKQVSGTW